MIEPKERVRKRHTEDVEVDLAQAAVPDLEDEEDLDLGVAA